MYQHRRLVVAIGAALVLATQTVSADEHREHGPHVHGIGHLNVVIDGPTLEIELDSPGANLIGFEHAPRDEAEQQQHDAVLAQLKENNSLFVMPDAAGCKPTSVNLTEDEVDEHEHEHEEGHAPHHDEDEEEHANHHEEEGEEHVHSDINVHYRFHCEKPAALDAIDVQLFQRFPATKKLQVQLIGPNGQKGGELTADDHRLRF